MKKKVKFSLPDLSGINVIHMLLNSMVLEQDQENNSIMNLRFTILLIKRRRPELMLISKMFICLHFIVLVFQQ